MVPLAGGRRDVVPKTEDWPLDALLRELTPQVIAILVRRFGQFDAVEDAVQEALISASTEWPRTGVPKAPRSWLVTVASRRLVDEWRRDSARRRREASSSALEVRVEVPARDDSLTLLFLCCHPALPTSAQIALTLRAVGGLTTDEIARAFLVPKATMAQRISRAKQQLQASGLSFELPTAAEHPSRQAAVLHVLYLIFNAGYTPSDRAAEASADLATEAIRLTRLLHALQPDDPEVAGLLALMLLTDARRAARASGDGTLIPLAEQDRTRWDRAMIAEGLALITGALTSGAVGPYQLQAAIAAVHDEAPTAEQTDWPQILALYSVLERLTPGPVVTLNRAVATAHVHGPRAGLAVLRTIDADGRMAQTHRLDAVRAHLLELAGDDEAARESYRRAMQGTASPAEQRYLGLREASLRSRPPQPKR